MKLFYFILVFSLLGQLETFAQSKVSKTISPVVTGMPVVYQHDIKGGYHQVTDLLNNDIPVNLKKIGMIAWDETTQFSYQWNGLSWNKVFVVRNWEIDLTFYKGQLFLKNNKLFKAETDGVILAAIEPDTDSDWTRIGVEVEDVLTSTSILNALSAHQGLMLNGKISDNQTKLNACPIGTRSGQMRYWNGTAWTLRDPAAIEDATLQIYGGVPVWVSPPGAPTIGVATAGNGRATVSYTAPEGNGGSVITSYTAISLPDGLTGKVIQSGDGIISVLGLTNGTPYTFTLKASNAVGMSAASDPSASVTPATVPDAPAISSVTAGNGEASVVYTAPANNGGALITSYTATSLPGGFTGTVSQVGDGTIIVAGLTNGTDYTFTVTATNAAGMSAASLASVYVTPGVPDAPTDVTAVAGDAMAIVSCTAPINDGGSAVTNYIATSEPGGFTGESANPTEIFIYGLTNEIAYTFTVRATNIVGTSTASDPSLAVSPSLVPSVYNPVTGRTWMDRNLGASRVATSPTDAAAYGDYYQWGRSADGHQVKNSRITSTNASSSAATLGTAWYGKFITEGSYPHDWLSTQDKDLWQGVNGINNPCPTGYRLPNNLEWSAERNSWTLPSSSAAAFESVLKLTSSGQRKGESGDFRHRGVYGYYWTADNTTMQYPDRTEWSECVTFGEVHGWSHWGYSYRSYGYNVRCIKD